MTPSVTGPSRWQLASALSALYHGETIAYPTEAVWGLGCDPFNINAVNRLLALKKRPVEKGLILVAANLVQVAPLLHHLSDAQLAQLKQSVSDTCVDRPTTWLIPSHGLVPYWITGEHDTVAVRISRHPTVAAICQAFGGMIVSTSANPRQRSPALTQLAVRCYFGKLVRSYVAGEVGCAGRPSEIRHLVTGEILR